MPKDQPSPLDELVSHFDAILDTLEPGFLFDSHWIFQRMTKSHQHEYIRALLEMGDDPAPFKNLHQKLADRLAENPKVEKTGNRRLSKTIFGDDVPNTEWRKRPS